MNDSQSTTKNIIEGCFFKFIVGIGCLIGIATGLSAVWSPYYRYVSLGVSLDLVRDAFSLFMGSTITALPLFAFNKKFALRFLFIMLILSGILGTISCTWFWLYQAGEPFDLEERSPFGQFIHTVCYLMCFGTGLFIVHWHFSRLVTLTCSLFLCIGIIIWFSVHQQFYMVVNGVYALLIIWLAYWKTVSALILLPISSIFFGMLSFLHYGRITWFVGINPEGGRHASILPLTILSPGNYIYVADNPEKFYSIITSNLLLFALLFGTALWLIKHLGSDENAREIWLNYASFEHKREMDI